MIRTIGYTLAIVAAASSAASAAPFVPERDAQCVAVSPDGSLVATGKSGMSNSEFPPRPHPTIRKCALIQIWDARSGQMLQRMQTYGDFTKLAFSPDGKLLGSCRLFTPGDGLEMSQVRLWEVATGKLVHEFNRCHAFDFSHDNEMIAVLSRSKCVLYELKDMEKARQVEPLGRSTSVAFSHDDQRILGIQHRDGGTRVLLCNAANGELLQESAPFDRPFYTMAVSSSGLLATGHEGVTLLWDIESLALRSQLKVLSQGLQHPFFSADGELLGTADQKNGDVVFWDLTTGKQVRRYTFEKGSFRTFHPRRDEDLLRPEKDPTRFAFLPDGQTFMAGCFGGMIRSISNGQEVKRFGY